MSPPEEHCTAEEIDIQTQRARVCVCGWVGGLVVVGGGEGRALTLAASQ
jgi:hypothetical protein